MGAATKWTKTETIRRVRKAGVMVRRHAGAAANTTVEVGQWTVEQVMPEMATEEHWATWHATQSEGDLFDFLTDWSSIGTDHHCRTVGAVVAIYVYDRSDGGEGLLNTYDVWLGNADHQEKFDKKIAPLHEAGIMSIFHGKPGRSEMAYVTLVTAYVNEGRV